MLSFTVTFEYDDEQVFAIWSTLYGQGDDEIEAFKDLKNNMHETYQDLKEIYITDRQLNPSLAQLFNQLKKVFE